MEDMKNMKECMSDKAMEDEGSETIVAGENIKRGDKISVENGVAYCCGNESESDDNGGIDNGEMQNVIEGAVAKAGMKGK
jgi:hypothetical protein